MKRRERKGKGRREGRGRGKGEEKEERKGKGREKRGDMRKRLRSEGKEKTVSTKLHVRRSMCTAYNVMKRKVLGINLKSEDIC